MCLFVVFVASSFFLMDYPYCDFVTDMVITTIDRFCFFMVIMAISRSVTFFVGHCIFFQIHFIQFYFIIFFLSLLQFLGSALLFSRSEKHSTVKWSTDLKSLCCNFFPQFCCWCCFWLVDWTVFDYLSFGTTKDWYFILKSLSMFWFLKTFGNVNFMLVEVLNGSNNAIWKLLSKLLLFNKRVFI